MYKLGYSINREYLDLLMNLGRKRIVDWYDFGIESKDAYDRIGKVISYDEAESILIKYRQGGVGPNDVGEVMKFGAVAID